MRLRLLPLVFVTACFMQNASPMERLQEAVAGLNDEARWGRVDLASAKVEPAYKPRFLATRSRWTKQIQIADVELTSVDLNKDSDNAISQVTVSWYQLSSMELRSTSLSQTWKRHAGRFFLVTERVVDGDATLIAPPPLKKAASIAPATSF